MAEGDAATPAWLAWARGALDGTARLPTIGASAVDDDLGVVVASAELDATATSVLALAAAVGIDPGLQARVVAAAADPRQARLDFALVADVLGPDAVVALAEDAALRRACLVEVVPATAWARTQVAVPDLVTWALLGDLSLDPAIPVTTEVVALPPGAIGLHDLVLVHGRDPLRRRQAALRALGPLAFLLTTPPADDHGWRVLVRQATVGGLGVVLDLPDGVTPETRYWVERADHLAWGLCSPAPLDLATAPRRDHVELAAAPPEITDEEWAAAFPGAGAPARRPTAEQLHTARSLPGAENDPQEAVRRVAAGSLVKHATRIVPKVGWDDLVLPPSQERQLRSLVDRYHQRSTVHDDWGLSLYPSPGVVALFSGPSGTGKTTSAEVVAKELGLEMFRVDLSALVSKYIGETEKNLEEIFSAAHTGNYLLLFDEADSLFGSRSKVEDAKDRYANMEVSYLLQRLETYDGVVVLTSNFQGNIDQAFLRRIHVTVAFSVPTAGERERIWDRSLGGAPRADLDLAFVAEKFDLTGGSIRNAALSAAFAAAAAGTEVGMVEVLGAVTTESAKLGRRVQDAQYGPWLAAVRDASR